LVAALGLVLSRRRRQRARAVMLAAVPWRGDEAVLDVGCGNGFLLVEAAKRLSSGKATGIDLWKVGAGGQRADAVWRNAELEQVRERIALTDGDARRMPFADGAFDVVLASLMLHHAGRRADRRQAMAEMMRVTRPGGRILLYDTLPVVRGAAEQLRAAGFVEIRRLAGWALAVVVAVKPR
jgi:ubiquinone/menaquinone biosynthesis C-methylase UbiE